MKLSFTLKATLAGTALAFATAAVAQINTAHGPLKLIVGYPAGGSADVQARTLADKLAAEIGTTVVVDNRTGAGGAIAADYGRSAPTSW